MDLNAEFNSLWVLRAGEIDAVKNYDDPLKCGDIILLEHVTSKKYLITNTDSPMLSNNYTVGCIDKSSAKPDNYGWKVECTNQASGSVVQGWDN